MVIKFHFNPETGGTGPCSVDANNPKSRGCPFGENQIHYDTEAEARAAYEETMRQDAIVTIRKNPERIMPQTEGDAALLYNGLAYFDENLDKATEEIKNFTPAETNAWVAERVRRLDEAHEALLSNGEVASINSTKEDVKMRVFNATVARNNARLELAVADVAVWRNSEFFTEEAEHKLRKNAFVVNTADKAITDALFDDVGVARVAKEVGVSREDVKNVLFVVQRNYARPRGGLLSSLESLTERDGFPSDVGSYFKMDPLAVQRVLTFAASHAK